MTIKQSLAESTQQLQKANIPSPHLDGEILLSHALGKPKEFLCAHPEYKMSKSARIRHVLFLQRRLAREPIVYIINEKEFYGLDFYVDRRVLIPRPETEKLVDEVKFQISNLKSKIYISNLKSKEDISLNPRVCVIDVGTGSGCIIISLIKKLLKFSTQPPPALPFRRAGMVEALNQIKFYATDISADALAVAKINAKKHKVEKYIKFYQGDLLEPIIKSIPKLFPACFRLSEAMAGRTFHHFSLFTFITANLPYITPKNYLTLAPEIKKYEPKLALLTPNENADYYYKKLDEQISELQRLTQGKIYRFYERTN